MGERKSKEHSLCPRSDTRCPCSILVTSGHSEDDPFPQLVPLKGEREPVSWGLALGGPSFTAL